METRQIIILFIDLNIIIFEFALGVEEQNKN